MAYKYVDTQLVTGLNDGSSFDNAWQSLKTALEASHSPGDVIWVRRRSSYVSGVSIVLPGLDGTLEQFIRVIGWPRATATMLSVTCTQGSTTVGFSGLVRERHQGRWFVGPDGRRYLITRVVSSIQFLIDRPYIGPTVTGAGAVDADEDLAEAQGIDDSGWTIKKTAWNADPHDLPYFDFGANAAQINGQNGSNYWKWCNLDFRNGAISTGTFYTAGGQWLAVGCLFKQTQAFSSVVPSSTSMFLQRCVVEGNGNGANQRGVSGYHVRMKDCAQWGAGGFGVSANAADLLFENVNLGVEGPNGAQDLALGLNSAKGYDLKLGAAVAGGFSGNSFVAGTEQAMLRVENWGKQLGVNLTMHIAPTMTMVGLPVVIGDGDPYKRPGGADMVADITAGSASPRLLVNADRWMELRIWAEPGQHTYRLYCQLKDVPGGIPAGLGLLRAFYIKDYVSGTLYQTGEADSAEPIALRTGADDWSQFWSVTVTQAVAGWVRLQVWAQWSPNQGHLYVDPKVVIL